MWCPRSGIAIPVNSDSFALFDGGRFAPSQKCIIDFVEWRIDTLDICIISENFRDICFLPIAKVRSAIRQ